MHGWMGVLDGLKGLLERYADSVDEPVENAIVESRASNSERLTWARRGFVDCLGGIVIMEPAAVEALGVKRYREVEYGGMVYYAVDVGDLPEAVRGEAERFCMRIEAELRRRSYETVEIDAALLRWASRLAWATGRSRREVVEEALRIGLAILTRRFRAGRARGGVARRAAASQRAPS